jgi:hypothetical protein
MSGVVCILSFVRTTVRNRDSKSYTDLEEKGIKMSNTITVEARKFIRQAIVVAVVTASAIGFISGQAATATSQAGKVSFEYVTVQSGQSLWSLASDLAPDQDPRDWIADVVSLNALTSAEVQAGQRIALP